jgi:hypothetical protein
MEKVKAEMKMTREKTREKTREMMTVMTREIMIHLTLDSVYLKH